VAEKGLMVQGSEFWVQGSAPPAETGDDLMIYKRN
jgi:hypothetical protein